MSQLTKIERYWLNHLTACQRSGVTIAEYTRRHKLTVSTFYLWRKRLASHLNTQAAPERAALFTPVEVVAQSQTEDVLVIHYPNGCRVELPCQRVDLLSVVLRYNDA